ncbi:hypothetical protein DJ564_30905 [Pseudomonas sp. 31-12]|uniref:hypothetical protein n=1 Tax=Pseudomonas sp. 31-12 TaxID=2201356 RepID=UPI000D6B58CF|nr:hypothetical protein [Pseudomonas sp. 31-12]AWM94885.1 hypothetical protein DJ564_30905 [Pseudomonas sp. 31-12]
MRYLEVIAQDRSGAGAADTVRFRFHEEEQMPREVTETDRQRMKALGNTYLKCAWFNSGEGEARHLRIFSQNPSADGTPETVRLHFHEGPVIAYKAAVRDLDNDGVFELILSSDVDNDGRANRTDRNRVRALVREFLKISA